jgi:hypothetical protein
MKQVRDSTEAFAIGLTSLIFLSTMSDQSKVELYEIMYGLVLHLTYTNDVNDVEKGSSTHVLKCPLIASLLIFIL